MHPHPCAPHTTSRRPGFSGTILRCATLGHTYSMPRTIVPSLSVVRTACNMSDISVHTSSPLVATSAPPARLPVPAALWMHCGTIQAMCGHGPRPWRGVLVSASLVDSGCCHPRLASKALARLGSLSRTMVSIVGFYLCCFLSCGFVQYLAFRLSCGPGFCLLPDRVYVDRTRPRCTLDSFYHILPMCPHSPPPPH